MTVKQQNHRSRTFFLQSGDTVKVTNGNGRGTTGKVLRVLRNKDRVVVEGVNMVWKHLRRSQENPHGSRIQKEAPIDISNVQVVCPSCTKPTRVAWTTDGKAKHRSCKKCGKPIHGGS